MCSADSCSAYDHTSCFIYVELEESLNRGKKYSVYAWESTLPFRPFALPVPLKAVVILKLKWALCMELTRNLSSRFLHVLLPFVQRHKLLNDSKLWSCDPESTQNRTDMTTTDWRLIRLAQTHPPIQPTNRF